MLARLGPGAFETISGEVVKAILLTLSRGNAASHLAELVAATQRTRWVQCTAWMCLNPAAARRKSNAELVQAEINRRSSRPGS